MVGVEVLGGVRGRPTFAELDALKELRRGCRAGLGFEDELLEG